MKKGFSTPFSSFFPGRFFSFFAFFDSLARRPCGLRASFGWSAVKAGIDGIKIAAVQGVLDGFQRLAEALEMDDLPFTQKTDGRDHVRVVHQTQNIVIGGAGFLLCCGFAGTTFQKFQCISTGISPVSFDFFPTTI